MIEGHGDDMYRYGAKVKINFSSNIYAKYGSEELQNYLKSNIYNIHSYPEPDALSLRSVLASKYKIEIENVLVANGATEAIYILAHAFQSSNTAILIPTFSEYEDACTINNHHLTYYTDIEHLENDLDMVWICNPNNPDGRIYDPNSLKQMLRNRPNTLFIIDQSYADLSETPTWNIADALLFKNIVLVHSMTKQHGIPGLRLGYITADAEVLQKVKKYVMPWSVNTLAIDAGMFLIENNIVRTDVKELLNESKRVQFELSKIKGLRVVSSPMHYFLCELESKFSAELKKWLIAQHGMLIRDASNFRGLNDRYFRVAVQSREDNDKLIKAIKEWI